MKVNLEDKQKPKYPTSVYLNGKIVGTMDRSGTVTFTDQSAVDTVISMMSKNAVGLSSKDAKGNLYKDDAIHFTNLGEEEDIKMDKHKTDIQRKRGRRL